MSIDYTHILDFDLPQVDRTQVRPSVQQVAIREMTRTEDQTGALAGTFTDTTYPTEAQCELVIDQAVEECLADLPDHLPESIYPRIQQAIVCKAACIIEHSFYREQYEQGSAKGHVDQYEKLLASIEMVSGGATAGSRVDSVMARSTMAEYEPDYPMPPPRVMPQWPIPFDGSSTDEQGEA